MKQKLMVQNKQLMKVKSSTANPTANPRGPPRVKRKCGSCNKLVFHPYDNCYKLEKNVDKRPS